MPVMKKDAKKATVKKPAKKPAKKVEATAPAKKRVGKRAVGKTMKGTGTKVGGRTLNPKREAVGRRPTTGVDFQEGSDAKTVFEFMLAGGDTRAAITAALQDHYKDQTTRGGQPKPVTTIMNAVLTRALNAGYTIESHWRLVKDPNAKKSTVDKPAKKATKKVAAKATVARKKPIKRKVSK